MKKVFVLLLLIQVICLTSLAADTATFDGSRNVLICRTTQDNYASHYLNKGIRDPFRIPWWNVINADEVLSSSDITEANLALSTIGTSDSFKDSSRITTTGIRNTLIASVSMLTIKKPLPSVLTP